jgi:hypothetical protein
MVPVINSAALLLRFVHSIPAPLSGSTRITMPTNAVCTEADRGNVTIARALHDNGTLDCGVHHRFLGVSPPGPASLHYPVCADVAGTGLSESH